MRQFVHPGGSSLNKALSIMPSISLSYALSAMVHVRNSRVPDATASIEAKHTCFCQAG